MSTDALDIGLSQAVVCAYAIPGAGAFIAAGFSIVQAVYDAYGKDNPPPTYSTAQAIADLGEEIAKDIGDQDTDNRLVVIKGWQKAVKQTNDDIKHWAETGDAAIAQTRMADFLEQPEYDEIFAWFDDRSKGDEQVQTLPMYFMARTAYHSLCLAKLQYYAVSRGLGGEHWIEAHSEVRTRFEESLGAAVKYAQALTDNLDDAFQHSEERALKKAKSEHPFDDRAKNLAFAKELRRLRAAASLEFTSLEQVDKFKTFLAAYRATTEGLTRHPLTAIKPDPAKAAGNAPVRKIIAGSLGKQADHTARFLYETTPTSWVNVLADSSAARGSIATQNAGSSNAGMYYQVDGGFLNGTFKSELMRAGQLQRVNKSLKTAYDARYGAGSYAADSASTSPRQDRLTSFIIPITPGTPPVGDSVYAMVYSVGPVLGAAGIADAGAYKQIYMDALHEISQWNRQHPNAVIQNFRITMISTNAYAGTTDKSALRQQAAGLILDAVKEAIQADSSLESLQILINTNDSRTPSERDAFDVAALSKGLKPVGEGFDLPLT